MNIQRYDYDNVPELAAGEQRIHLQLLQGGDFYPQLSTSSRITHYFDLPLLPVQEELKEATAEFEKVMVELGMPTATDSNNIGYNTSEVQCAYQFHLQRLQLLKYLKVLGVKK